MKPVQAKSRSMLDAGGVSATDIIMNLFIFFFIAFSLLATFKKPKDEGKEGHHEVKLPSSSALPAQPPNAVSLVVGKSGIWVNDEQVTRGELPEVLSRAMAGADGHVVLRADKDIPLGDIVSYLDAARAAGASSLAIATVNPAAGKE